MEEQIKYKIFVSTLLNSNGANEASIAFKDVYKEFMNAIEGTEIELTPIKNTSDIWMRDYMPIQIDKKTFVTYYYQPDYLSCKERKHLITKRFASTAKIEENRNKFWNENESRLPFYAPNAVLRECRLVLDGGNVVVCGEKVILTDKVFIENRPKSTDYVIGELKRAFGKEVIIIPSDPYEIDSARKENELPLCHADGVLAPIDDKTILIADYGNDPLGYVPQLMNALTPHFKPKNIKHFDFGEDWTEDAWIYINFLRIGDLVLMPTVNYIKKSKEEGNETTNLAYQEKLKRCNEKAKQQLKSFLGIDKIKAIDTTTLSLGKNKYGDEINPDNYGGALHCITWEVTE